MLSYGLNITVKLPFFPPLDAKFSAVTVLVYDITEEIFLVSPDAALSSSWKMIRSQL